MHIAQKGQTNLMHYKYRYYTLHKYLNVNNAQGNLIDVYTYSFSHKYITSNDKYRTNQ